MDTIPVEQPLAYMKLEGRCPICGQPLTPRDTLRADYSPYFDRWTLNHYRAGKNYCGRTWFQLIDMNPNAKLAISNLHY